MGEDRGLDNEPSEGWEGPKIAHCMAMDYHVSKAGRVFLGSWPID